jgi:hypothetical protein
MRKSENTRAAASRPATKPSKRDAADAMRDRIPDRDTTGRARAQGGLKTWPTESGFRTEQRIALDAIRELSNELEKQNSISPKAASLPLLRSSIS